MAFVIEYAPPTMMATMGISSAKVPASICSSQRMTTILLQGNVSTKTNGKSLDAPRTSTQHKRGDRVLPALWASSLAVTSDNGYYVNDDNSQGLPGHTTHVLVFLNDFPNGQAPAPPLYPR